MEVNATDWTLVFFEAVNDGSYAVIPSLSFISSISVGFENDFFTMVKNEKGNV